MSSIEGLPADVKANLEDLFDRVARLTDKQNRNEQQLLHDIRKTKTSKGEEYQLMLGPEQHASAATVLRSLAALVCRWREPGVSEEDKRWLHYLAVATETLRMMLGEDLGTEWDILFMEMQKRVLAHATS